MKSFAELSNLRGRVAAVTGGAGHLGRVIGSTLVELGAKVFLIDLEGAGLERAAREVEAEAVPANLADEDEARGAIREIVRGQGLDVFVHSAALVGTDTDAGWAVRFDEQTVSAWDAAMRVNVTSAFAMVQEARPALEATGRSSVILVGSIYGIVAPDFRVYDGTAMHNPAGYGVSKAGLVQLGRYLATALAPRVRVNAITPGGIARGQPERFVEQYVSRTPLGRMAVEQDFKGVIGFLASDLSQYVTGQNIVVDGGWSSW